MTDLVQSWASEHSDALVLNYHIVQSPMPTVIELWYYTDPGLSPTISDNVLPRTCFDGICYYQEWTLYYSPCKFPWGICGSHPHIIITYHGGNSIFDPIIGFHKLKSMIDHSYLTQSVSRQRIIPPESSVGAGDGWGIVTTSFVGSILVSLCGSFGLSSSGNSGGLSTGSEMRQWGNIAFCHRIYTPCGSHIL